MSLEEPDTADFPNSSPPHSTPRNVTWLSFVFKKNRNYNIASMDSPALKQLKIGFESGTPAEDGVKMRGLLERSTSFDIAQNSEESPALMLTALETGRIDVLITWEPAISACPERLRPMSDRKRAKAVGGHPLESSRSLLFPKPFTSSP